MFQQPARKHDHVDVWRLSLHASRTHRLKNATAVLIRTQSSKTAKCRIAIFPGWIGLPQLDQRIGDRSAVAIDNKKRKPDALARYVRGGDACQVHISCKMKK